MLKWREKSFKFGFDLVYKHFLDKQDHAEVNIYFFGINFFERRYTLRPSMRGKP